MTPHDFLTLVFGDKAADETICVAKGNPSPDNPKNTLFWNVKPDHEAFTGWAARSTRNKQAWYFCVSTVNGTLNERGTALRRRGQDLVRYHCLVLDDIGTKAEAPPVEPAWKMETSAGNYQWGYLLEPGDDFGRYEALLQWAHERGWGDGGAGGAYRIMRLPGSTNLKPGRDKFQSVVEICDDGVWALEALGTALGVDINTLAVTRTKSVRMRAGGADAADLLIVDPMATWLAENGHVVEDVNAAGWMKIVCPWASAHTTGENTAGYSPLGRGGDKWAETRGFKCLHEHCGDKHIRELRDWAVSQGGPWVAGVDPLPWLQARYSYVGDGKRIADLVQRPHGGKWLWELEEWSMLHYRKIEVADRDQPVLIKTAFLEHADTTRVCGARYLPGARAVARVKNQQFVNTYVEPQHAETDAKPEVFLEHVRWLCSDEAESVLDWLAYKIQHPARRSYAVVMVADGAFGTGRSWLRAMLAAVLEGKVNNTSLAQLIGQGTSGEQNFNDWAAECQFVVVEEAKDNLSADDFYHGYESFKQKVDPRVVEFRCNPKYGKTRDDTMFFNALIFSNHADAMVIPQDERRLHVVANPPEMRDREYYERLEGSLDGGEPGRVYWYLKRRDVTAYDRIYPPDTAAKFAMMEQSRTAYDEVLDAVEEGLEGDIITRKLLQARIQRAARDLGHDQLEIKPGKMLARVWRRYGNLRSEDPKNGARYLIDTDRQEVRAVRNKSSWIAADEHGDRSAIIGELKKNQPDVTTFPQSSKKL